MDTRCAPSAAAFIQLPLNAHAGNCLGAVAVKIANYGSFSFILPLELPSSSYYQASGLNPNPETQTVTVMMYNSCCNCRVKVEVRSSDNADAVGMSSVFSVAQDGQV